MERGMEEAEWVNGRDTGYFQKSYQGEIQLEE